MEHPIKTMWSLALLILVLTNESISIPCGEHEDNFGMGCPAFELAQLSACALRTCSMRSLPAPKPEWEIGLFGESHDCNITMFEECTPSTKNHPTGIVMSPDQILEELFDCMMNVEKFLKLEAGSYANIFTDVALPIIENVLGTLGLDKRSMRESSVWNKGRGCTTEIPYTYDSGISSNIKRLVETAMKIYHELTCVRWVPVKNRNDNHVIIQSSKAGCYSYIGKVNIIPQPLNLNSRGCARLGIVMHELAHSMGMWHQQSRSDRDDHIVIHYENIKNGREVNFNRRDKSEHYGVPYDHASTMHYRSAAFQRAYNLVTITAKDSDFQRMMGARVSTTFYDIMLINRHFCRGCCSSSASKACRHGGYQNPNQCNSCFCPDGLAGPTCDDVEKSTKGCGGEINLNEKKEEACITTNNYPNKFNSADSCNWLINAPPQHKIRANFDVSRGFQFTVANSGGVSSEFSQCLNWVEVRYKGDLSARGPRFCEEEQVENNRSFTSTDRQMLITMRANFYRSKGFKMCFKLIAPPKSGSKPSTSGSFINLLTRSLAAV